MSQLSFMGQPLRSVFYPLRLDYRDEKETTALETGNFYAEQTRCAVCNRPTTRIGKPEIDVMKGKEPVICGFCLVEMAKITTEQKRKNA